MRTWIEAVRFFSVVPPVSRLMWATFAVVGVAGAVLLVLVPAAGPAVVRPLLVLQSYAAASGFLVPARRGHYDLLLTRVPDRRVVVLAHALMSILPGALTWGGLAAVEWTRVPAGDRCLARPGTACALAIVSLVAWALTATRPRFAGAIGWWLIVATASRWPALPPPEGAVWPRDGLVGQAVQVLVWPGGLLTGEDGSSASAWVAVAIAALWAAAVVRRVSTTSLGLEAGQ